jgi:hypothetical protein
MSLVAAEYDYNIPEELDIIYNEEWLDMVDSRWRKYKTFAGLLKNMAKFVKNEIPNTPIHMGAIQDTDPKYISKLLDLIACGVLPVGGQEFKRIIKKNEIYMQREYLDYALILLMQQISIIMRWIMILKRYIKHRD